MVQNKHLSRIKNKASAMYIKFGTKIMLFSKKHPYIFTQIILYCFAILGAVLAVLFNYGGN